MGAAETDRSAGWVGRTGRNSGGSGTKENVGSKQSTLFVSNPRVSPLERASQGEEERRLEPEEAMLCQE